MSEEGIDMERCMQGVDDEAAWIPKIIWTNCAERMPPDDLDFNIIYNLSEPRYNKGSGHTLHFCIKEFSNPDKLKAMLMWTEFTVEKWEWLTRNNNKTRLSINNYDPSSPNGYD